MTLQTTVETRMAFADRRKALLANWLGAQETASILGQENLTYWAERIQAVNDAEIAVVGVTY